MDPSHAPHLVGHDARLVQSRLSVHQQDVSVLQVAKHLMREKQTNKKTNTEHHRNTRIGMQDN